MLTAIWIVSLVILSLAMLGCLYRVIKGPSIADRIVAMDAISMNVLGMVAILSALLKTEAYFDTILVIGIIAFLGTTAFARYIERGVVIERGSGQDDR